MTAFRDGRPDTAAMMAGEAPIPEPEPELELVADPAPGDGDAAPTAPLAVSGRINWLELLTEGPPDPDWLVEPFLPRGRLVSLVASAKVGKSLFTVELAVALATGRAFLDRGRADPVSVLLLDFEMTRDDVAERAADMGVTVADADLLDRYLHYYVTPDLRELNSDEGATQLLSLVEHYDPALVVVDTVSRAVAGNENDSEPFRDAYRLAWAPLKRRGVTVLRLDHTGHNEKVRARGSSGKRDDVDVQWTMTPTDGDGRELAHHGTSRLTWVPERVNLVKVEGDPPIHRLASDRAWPPGTGEWADLLDQLDAPTDLGERKLRGWVNEPGRLDGTDKTSAPKAEVLRAAIKYRADPSRQHRQGP